MNKYCRTCLSEASINRTIYDIILIENEHIPIIDMLSKCTGIKESDITQNLLSKFICDICVQKLFDSFLFRKKCFESYSVVMNPFINANNVIIRPDGEFVENVQVKETTSAAATAAASSSASQVADKQSREIMMPPNAVAPSEVVACTICGTALANRELLALHMERVHAKKMKSKSQSSRHEVDEAGNPIKPKRKRTHSNNEIPCLECGKMYRNKYILKTHLRKVHLRETS